MCYNDTQLTSAGLLNSVRPPNQSVNPLIRWTGISGFVTIASHQIQVHKGEHDIQKRHLNDNKRSFPLTKQVNVIYQACL